MIYVPPYLCTTCTPGERIGQKVWDSLELQLLVLSNYVDIGNRTWVVWKNSQVLLSAKPSPPAHWEYI